MKAVVFESERLQETIRSVSQARAVSSGSTSYGLHLALSVKENQVTL